MDFKEGIFDLSAEQEESVKMIYDNKIVKCLVAPYHTYDELEKHIPFTKSTFLFPERDLPITRIKQLMSMIVANPAITEAIVITKNQNIIQDMVGGAVRVLTENGDIVDTGTRTFMANIHDIRYELLENEDHQKSASEKEHANKAISELIERVQPGSSCSSKDEYDKLKAKIDIIGEMIIRRKMQEMFRDNVFIK